MTNLHGPPQFRLNQGTAKKWRALLATTDWRFDAGQLSFAAGKDTYGSPEGLLASIAQPVPATAWDGASHLYDGSQFYITDAMKRRLKLRGTLPEFESFGHALWYLDQMAAHHGMQIQESRQ